MFTKTPQNQLLNCCDTMMNKNSLSLHLHNKCRRYLQRRLLLHCTYFLNIKDVCKEKSCPYKTLLPDRCQNVCSCLINLVCMAIIIASTLYYSKVMLMNKSMLHIGQGHGDFSKYLNVRKKFFKEKVERSVLQVSASQCVCFCR